MTPTPGQEGTVSDEQITPDGTAPAAPEEGAAGPGGPSRRGLLKAGIVAGAVAGVGGWRPAPGHPGHHRHLRKPNSLPYPRLPAGTDTIPQIEHIVVLMMENHSYDNRLGMLKRPGADGFHLRHGLPTATNPYANGDLQHAFRMPATCQLNGKPAQDWLDSHLQFNHGRNDGFVKSGSGPVAMGYWQQADQPFYYSLAQAFPIADRYFCSLLGQTFPNRRYLMGATSIGQVNDTIPNESDYPANGTIFDKLDAHGITWRDYYTTLPTTLLYRSCSSRSTAPRSSRWRSSSPTRRRATCPGSAWWSRTSGISRRRTRRTSRPGSSSPRRSSTRC